MGLIAQQYKKRAKHVQKMTRDGLVDQNLVTGEEKRVSMRGLDINLKAEPPPKEQLRTGNRARQPDFDGDNRARSGKPRNTPQSDKSKIITDSADTRIDGLPAEPTQLELNQQIEQFPQLDALTHDITAPDTPDIPEASFVADRPQTLAMRADDKPLTHETRRTGSERRTRIDVENKTSRLDIETPRSKLSEQSISSNEMNRAEALSSKNAENGSVKPRKRNIDYDKYIIEDAPASDSGSRLPPRKPDDLILDDGDYRVIDAELTRSESVPGDIVISENGYRFSGAEPKKADASHTALKEHRNRLRFDDEPPQAPVNTKPKYKGTQYQRGFIQDIQITREGASPAKRQPAPVKSETTSVSVIHIVSDKTPITEPVTRTGSDAVLPRPVSSGYDVALPQKESPGHEAVFPRPDCQGLEIASQRVENPSHVIAPARMEISVEVNAYRRTTENVRQLTEDVPGTSSGTRALVNKYGNEIILSESQYHIIDGNEVSVDSGSESLESGSVTDARPDTAPALPPKRSKLEFSKDELAPDTSGNRKLDKAWRRVEKSGAKLDDSRKKLPAKRHIRLRTELDDGKPKRRLRIEKEVKSQQAHIKGPLPLRPVKAGANAGIGYVHKKIYSVEHENVGVEAAHKGELVMEGGLRKAYRHGKTHPYRRVTKFQHKLDKNIVKYNYQKALHENPKLKSNIFSRMAQKRKIKKQYAKAVREAERAGKRVKDTAVTTGKIIAKFAGVVSRHPLTFTLIALFLLIIIFIMGMLGSCINMFTGGFSSIAASSYLASDESIERSELSYGEWETDLLMQALYAANDHLGYDEYNYNIDNVGHDPLELMAYLTAVYGDFEYSDIEAVLREIFAEQYRLDFDTVTETRYRTETVTGTYIDDDGFEQTYTYNVDVPYEWRILNVTLTSRPLSDVIGPRMEFSQRMTYELLLETRGNRQYTGNPFDFDWLPYVSSYYGWRVHPITGAKDYHKGIDIAVAEGAEIRAAHDGKVTMAEDAGSYGLVVVINDGRGLETKYAHCDALLVSVGQRVNKGDVIARVGSTGNSTGPHLHYEVIKNGVYMNPIFFADTGGSVDISFE